MALDLDKDREYLIHLANSIKSARKEISIKDYSVDKSELQADQLISSKNCPSTRTLSSVRLNLKDSPTARKSYRNLQ